jgi:cytochrome c556
MKRLILAFAVIAAWLCNSAAHAATPSECFSTSAAVFAAHPNAAHASYVVRGQRCWFADSFRKESEAIRREAKANPAPASHPVAAASRTSAQLHVTTERHAMTAPAPAPSTAAAPAAPWPVMVQFKNMPPALQMVVNTQGSTRLLQDDETPADFESRFSVSGYNARK